ncbi:MAG: nucleotidyl transferase AbiEii/AbiGii toxin family protein [Bacillota bacterium]|nr:nucleotidyl transferase AbiEii/AbiGii toxin family protein [Bacillota bacterium]MDW7676596.1 nucleotidyl transferase AbiEii/AbiGii toxin family protein [Bacillota bacterium]
MLRAHILPAGERAIVSEHFAGAYQVKTLDPIEIYGSKINALLNRAAARDLYDTASMIAAGLFDAHEEVMLRKCVVFYGAISSKSVNRTFETDAMDRISRHVIKTELLPVLQRGDDFNLEAAKKTVKEYLQRLLVLTEEEKGFLERFENGVYVPELLFDDPDLLRRIQYHPMALWKTMPR